MSKAISGIRFICSVGQFTPNKICLPPITQRVPRLSYHDDVYTPESEYPPPPEYKPKDNESLNVMKSRLLYQSRKRGISENGLLLSTFAAKYLDTYSEKQLHLYDTLINKPSNDWEIFYWAIGNRPVPDEYNNEIMESLKEFAQNKNLESRIRQPDLPSI